MLQELMTKCQNMEWNDTEIFIIKIILDIIAVNGNISLDKIFCNRKYSFEFFINYDITLAYEKYISKNQPKWKKNEVKKKRKYIVRMDWHT